MIVAEIQVVFQCLPEQREVFVSAHASQAWFDVEECGRDVQIVKNRATGFRTLDAFNDMIFLTVGDLNIPEQIPKRFRTL